MRSVDHSEVLFARSCDDLVCANGFECVQLNTIFAKCCQRNNLDQISIAMQTLTLVNEKDTRSSLIARGQIKRQSPLNGSKNFTSPCTMPKDEGHCNSGPIRIVQFFYYDPEWQSCFAFKYVGCGGNANRFVTRDDCESKCLYADGSVCKGPLVPVEPFTQTPPCTDSICPQGYTCSYGFGFMECCNSTIQQFVIDAYSSTCPDGSPAGGINEDHFIATFAKTCSNLICDAGQRCVQVSQYFAKCCGLIPPVQPPPLPVVENGHKGYGSPADEPPASFSSYYTGPKSNMPDGATDAGNTRVTKHIGRG
ncbi:Major allergen Ani s 1 [Toxocara canis]|uniref:Major allergen Ani s 1 n=1 Tax=Toxocara canis TaxID=6265 RepID=A0A0B2UZQ1_TOXCA|nr:Major allergen Ani s 1 [Toxocara canis]